VLTDTTDTDNLLIIFLFYALHGGGGIKFVEMSKGKQSNSGCHSRAKRPDWVAYEVVESKVNERRR
jgi:hypothetical protein